MNLKSNFISRFRLIRHKAESIKIALLLRESCSPTIMTKNYEWETKNRMTTLSNKIAQGGDNRVLSPIDFFAKISEVFLIYAEHYNF